MVRPVEKRALGLWGAARPPHGPPDPKRAGFTLTEMMMVVTIIAITAGLAAPAMYNAFAERRTATAPIDFIRMVRRGRSEAMAYGRAHLIRFSSSSPGSFMLYRGVSSSCVGNDWTAIIPTSSTNPCGEPGSDNQMCIEEMRLGGSYYTTGSLSVHATESSAASDVDLCFEPDGRTLFRKSTSATLTSDNTINGGLIFNFRRYDSGAPIGVVRQVVVPLGGDARLMR